MPFPTSGSSAPLRKFTTAERFRMAYSILDSMRSDEQYGSTVELYIPRTVCGAFAVEVYLKCLLCDFGTPFIPQKHQLRLLFDNLPREQKQRIGKLWRAQGNDGTIEAVLDFVSLSYDHWRYVFEREFADLEPCDFEPLHQVLRGFILWMHPDWEKDDPRFFLPTSQDP